MSADAPSHTDPPAEDEKPSTAHRVEAAHVGLGLLALLFAAYAALSVPRLTNNLVGDSEFTGWSAPIGERIAAGEAPYVDFVLPIPPGSLALMALIQKLTGTELLIHELIVAAVAHFGMCLLAYATARRFTTRENAFLTAAASLVTVMQLYKECAYDHTAQLAAWGSIAAGAVALTSQDRLRARWWIVAGTLATFTLAFKQSTGMGICLGWLAAEGVLAVQRRDLKRLRQDARPLALGAALGLGLLLALLLLLSSTPQAFIQSVFLDGPELKGGSRKLLFNLFTYTFRDFAVPASLGLCALVALILRRILKQRGRLSAGTPDSDDSPKRTYFATVIVLVGFGAVLMLLASSSRAVPPALLAWSERAKLVPAFGLLATLLYFIGQVKPERADDQEHERCHALNALIVAALVTTLLHNLSFPAFRPFYDNNPIIVVAFLFLFVAFDQAQLPRLKLVVFAAALFALPSHKLSRALEAHIPAGAGYLNGMRVNERGEQVVAAARRARALAGPTGTVLVLPEDVTLARLINRPRPPIRGAIVFVDQYASRLLEPDLATLDEHPPKVVVIHPAEATLWKQMFALWSQNSPAEKLIDRFEKDWLPTRYRLAGSYPTRFARRRAELQVWVLKE